MRNQHGLKVFAAHDDSNLSESSDRHNMRARGRSGCCWISSIRALVHLRVPFFVQLILLRKLGEADYRLFASTDVSRCLHTAKLFHLDVLQDFQRLSLEVRKRISVRFNPERSANSSRGIEEGRNIKETTGYPTFLNYLGIALNLRSTRKQ